MSGHDIMAGPGSTAEYDVVVVGAGPAGIAAAVSAAESGRNVALLDSGLRPGGQIWRHRSRAELPGVARRWLGRLDRTGAEILNGTTVVDAQRSDDSSFTLTLERPGAAVTLQAQRLILTTGARELFLPFPGWTLPNVFGVGGAQALLKSGAPFDGKRVVIAGSGPLLLAVAASMKQHGAQVALVAEQARLAAVARFGAGLWRSPRRLIQAAGFRAALGTTRYATGTWVTAAAGAEEVRKVTLTDGRRSWTEHCDILCTGYGLIPNTELAELLGCTVEGGQVRVDEAQRTSVAGVYAAGEPTGIAGVAAALFEGEIAGLHASVGGPTDPRLRRQLRQEQFFARQLEDAFAPRAELRVAPPDETIICRCEDVTLEMLDPTWSFRQAKLYTRIGMGPCQARVCGPAHELLFGSYDRASRPPVLPVAASTLIVAGRPDDNATEG